MESFMRRQNGSAVEGLGVYDREAEVLGCHLKQ